MNNSHHKQITLIRDISHNISAHYLNDANFSIEKATRTYLNSMNDYVAHKGKTWTCNHFKQLHNIAIRVATDDTIPNLPFTKVDKFNIPHLLRPVRRLLKSKCHKDKRIGLTVTRMYEQFLLPPKLDPEAITAPGPELSEELLESWDEFLEWWLSKLSAKGLQPPTVANLRDSHSMGPNGPAVITAHRDAIALQRDTDLYTAVKDFAGHSGGEELLQRIEKLAEGYKNLPRKISKDPVVRRSQLKERNKSLTGRIALLPENGGKTRSIAIGDYWTQNLLSPLHKFLMGRLKRFVTDGTWDQDSQFLRILRETPGKDSYCFDLSSATDRFPIVLQERLLAKMFNKDYAKSWREIVSNRPFKYKSEELRWSAGQPLGLLSSWAVFAFTHHALIEFCSWKEGFQSFKQYAVLGDDVCIWNGCVAKSYQRLINTLGVQINLGKSLISEAPIQRIEFAKRIGFNGKEISGLSYRVLLEATKSIYNLVDLTTVLEVKNWEMNWSEFKAPSFLSEKGKELLHVLLWERKSILPAREGSTAISPSLEELKTKTLQLRLISLKKRVDSLNELYSRNTSISRLFEKREGIAHSEVLIGTQEFYSNHPISAVINQQSSELMSTVMMIEDDLEEIPGTFPEIYPIEYMPLPLTGAYFADKHRLKAKRRSQMVLQAWFELTSQK